MITNKESKINGEVYKPKRSISSKIGNEVEDDNINYKKIKSRHRKTASSYFLGSYVSGNELNKFLQEYKESNSENINNQNNINLKDNVLQKENNQNIEKKNEISNLKNLLFENKENLNKNIVEKEKEKDNENFLCLTNASFYSYSIDDNNDIKIKENFEDNSVLIKGEEESSTFNNNEMKSNSYIVNNNNLFSNNPFYELEKNKEKYSQDKSFIPIKNGLKYIKDKEERVTESYLLALNGGESNIKKGKNPYLSTASIIEEERSEFIESTSKKQSIIASNRFVKDMNFKKKKIENEFNLVQNEKDNILEKTEEEENKENIDINIIKKKNEINNAINKKNTKMEFDIDLNKIKIQKNKKVDKIKKCIRKNKENLLNSFFNLSCNRSIPSSNNSKRKEESYTNSSAIPNTQKINNRIINKTNASTNITNFSFAIKDKVHQEFFKNQNKTTKNLNNKKKRTNSYNGGYISYLYNQRFNTENSNNKTNDKIKFNISKFVYQKNNKNIIYNIYNNTTKENISKTKYELNKAMNKSLISKIKFNTHMKIPHKKFDKTKVQKICKNVCPSKKNILNTSKNKSNDNKILLDLSNHRKSLSISKLKIDTISKHKKVYSIGGIENKINKVNLNIDRSATFKKPKPVIAHVGTNIEKINNSQIISKRNKNMIINSKENVRLPTYSDSRSSRLNQKIRYRMITEYDNKKSNKIMNIRKANSGLLKVKLDSDIENKSEFDINISNKNQTLIFLRDKIKFLKSYKKNDVLEKILYNANNNKSNYILLCEKNNDDFIFCGLYKYFEKDKKFVKIYGNEEISNYILIKDINKANYNMYENKIIRNEENKIKFLFEQLNSFYFSFNAIIICKK